jgi:hypothetical protein
VKESSVSVYADYLADPESEDVMGPAIYGHEIQALGLEESELFYPGAHVDAHVQIMDGSVARITFRSKIFVENGKDDQGNPVPVLHGLKFFGQTWDTGGSYLNPQMKSPEEYA